MDGNDALKWFQSKSKIFEFSNSESHWAEWQSHFTISIKSNQNIQSHPQEDNHAAFGSKKDFAPSWDDKDVSVSYNLLLWIINIYNKCVELFDQIPGVEGLPVRDQPMGGGNLQARALQEEGEEGEGPEEKFKT